MKRRIAWRYSGNAADEERERIEDHARLENTFQKKKASNTKREGVED